MEELACETEVVYSGDTCGLDPGFCRKAQLLLHEASLLDEADEDADKGIHSTLRHTLEIAAQAEVRHLVLFHISRRYDKELIQSLVAKAVAEARLHIPVLAIQGAFGLPTD